MVGPFGPRRIPLGPPSPFSAGGGARGVRGPQGPAGSGGGGGGSQGPQGPQGPQGNQGATGAGAQGPQGSQGFQGDAGVQGNQGSQGNQGAPADLNVRTIVVSDAIVLTDDVILANASPITVTLPDPTLTTGRVFTVKKINAAVTAVTIVPFAAETIDGMASVVISSPNESVDFLSDGTNWWVI